MLTMRAQDRHTPPGPQADGHARSGPGRGDGPVAGKPRSPAAGTRIARLPAGASDRASLRYGIEGQRNEQRDRRIRANGTYAQLPARQDGRPVDSTPGES